MRCYTILLMTLLVLPGCRDDKAKDRAARATKAAQEARIEREVAKRVSTERLASTERKARLHTIRVIGFIVLTGGTVSWLVWLQNHRGSNPVRLSASNQHALPPQAYDHYPVKPGRVLDLQQPSPPTRHRRKRRRRNRETASHP